MYPRRKVQIWLGVCLIGLGLLIFLPLMSATGLYFPQKLTQFYLGDSCWSKDSKTIQFRAEFPIGSQYEINVDGKGLKTIGYVRDIGYVDEMRSKDSGLLLRDYGLISFAKEFDLELHEVRPSPDGRYLAIATNKTSFFLGTEIVEKHIYIIEENTGKVRFVSDRSALVRKIKLQIYGYSIRLIFIEIVNWVVILLGLVLILRGITNIREYVHKFVIAFVLLVCLYFFYYFLYIAFADAGHNSGF